MSVIFSGARGAFMCKTGYNRFSLSCSQYNLLMGCGPASSRPQYMRVVPGNVKKGSAVNMLDEFYISEGTVLVMDRGYNDKKLLKTIIERNLNFVVAVKRNANLYKTINTSEGMFRWQESAVSYGHNKTDDGNWAYRFENLTYRNDELVDTLAARDQGKKRELNMEKAGNFVILSSLELEPKKKVYEMYKTRCSIEAVLDLASGLV